MRVPNEFVHPLFFREGEPIAAEERAPFPHMMKRVYFYYDIVPPKPGPWEQPEQSLPLVLGLWEEEKERLTELFAKRDRAGARAPMIRGLSYLLSLLFWLNGRRVPTIKEWRDAIEGLALLPLNGAERLQFIFDRCDAYASFVQLSELFDEAAKLLYKKQAMQRKRER